MSPLTGRLLQKHEGLSWGPQKPCKKPGTVACTCNSSTGEVGTSHRGSGQRVCLFRDFQVTIKGRPMGVY